MVECKLFDLKRKWHEKPIKHENERKILFASSTKWNPIDFASYFKSIAHSYNELLFRLTNQKLNQKACHFIINIRSTQTNPSKCFARFPLRGGIMITSCSSRRKTVKVEDKQSVECIKQTILTRWKLFGSCYLVLHTRASYFIFRWIQSTLQHNLATKMQSFCLLRISLAAIFIRFPTTDINLRRQIHYIPLTSFDMAATLLS